MLTSSHTLSSAPRRTVAPTQFPISMTEARWAIGDVSDDPEIEVPLNDKIYEAVDIVERDSRRQLMPQTWHWDLPGFPCNQIEIELYKIPVLTLSFIKYITNGVLTTLDPIRYQAVTGSEPYRIRPAAGYYWPSTDCDTLNAVQIEWTAGYASPAALKADRSSARSALILALQHLWNGCELGDDYWDMIHRMQP